LLACFSKESFTRELILRHPIDLVSAPYLLVEFEEYKDEIFLKSHLDKWVLLEIENILLSKIIIIPQDETKHLTKEAISISLDLDDSPFFEVALHLDIPIWSNDKRLKEQNRVKVLSTEEVAGLFVNRSDT
jgi:predicted nucleic acid-binding protein